MLPVAFDCAKGLNTRTCTKLLTKELQMFAVQSSGPGRLSLEFSTAAPVSAEVGHG